MLPIDFEIAFSDYRGIAQVDQEMVAAGSATVPIQFSQGHVDSLRIDNYIITSDRNAGISSNDSLTIIGRISTAEPIDLAGKSVNVRWASNNFEIPGNSSGLRQLGQYSIYYYSPVWPSSNQLIYAFFDFENSIFRILIRQATLLEFPPTNFTIQFEDDLFDESVPVN